MARDKVPLWIQRCAEFGVPVSTNEFDIRAWMREHNVALPVDDPDVRTEVITLLRRDLTPELLAAYAERRQRS